MGSLPIRLHSLQTSHLRGARHKCLRRNLLHRAPALSGPSRVARRGRMRHTARTALCRGAIRRARAFSPAWMSLLRTNLW